MHELTMLSTLPTSPEIRVIADQSCTFYFVRHGATEPNLRGLRCGGDLDVALTEIGREQAHTIAHRIRAMKIGVGLIVSSALTRARQTAAIVSGILGDVPIAVEPLLNERRLGEWNLRPVAATEHLLAKNVTPPGGESEQVFVGRILAALERFPELLPLNPLVVSSNGVGRVLNSLLGDGRRLNLANGEIVQLTMQTSAPPMAFERIPT